jgi:hypothetical protein
LVGDENMTNRKRYGELLSQGIRPSEALQIIEWESRGQESGEIDRSGYQHPVPAGSTTTFGELKHLGHEIGREITEFPRRILKEAAEDIETGRKYHEAYRKNKIYSASSRGAESEKRHYSEKVGKEDRKIKLEDERERISLAAEKAARVERAKILTRQRYGLQSRSSQFARPQMIGLSQPVFVQPRRYITNMWNAEAATALDPLNIFSINPRPQENPGYSDIWLSIVGMPRQQANQRDGQQKPTKTKAKPKRRVQNIFSGQWIWVE